MLKAARTPIPNHTWHEWAPWDAFIHAASPDALFEEYTSAGVTFRQSIRMMPMGCVDLK
jgi:hypothetical protein